MHRVFYLARLGLSRVLVELNTRSINLNRVHTFARYVFRKNDFLALPVFFINRLHHRLGAIERIYLWQQARLVHNKSRVAISGAEASLIFELGHAVLPDRPLIAMHIDITSGHLIELNVIGEVRALLLSVFISLHIGQVHIRTLVLVKVIRVLLLDW